MSGTKAILLRIKVYRRIDQESFWLDLNHDQDQDQDQESWQDQVDDLTWSSFLCVIKVYLGTPWDEVAFYVK